MSEIRGPPGIWVEIWWKKRNNYNFEIDLEITDAPNTAHVIYWGHQFGFTNYSKGGYMGLQIVNAQKIAIFSIWDAITGLPEEDCVQIYENGPVRRCRINYEWKLKTNTN